MSPSVRLPAPDELTNPDRARKVSDAQFSERLSRREDRAHLYDALANLYAPHPVCISYLR